jgi:outer membrane protein insertion porin family
MRYKPLIFLSLILLNNLSFAFESFLIKDINIKGLTRISKETVFNYLTIKPGNRFSPNQTSSVISTLFKAGLFKDIRLERNNNILIVRVEERPAIAKITFTGNKDLETDDLLKSLKSANFVEGRLFNRSLLDKIKLDLQRQYLNTGKYAVRLKSTVTPLARNRVAIKIDISEGVVARINQINFVGNKVISDDDLLYEMKLSTGGWFSFFTQDNQYSSLKLRADLEKIRSYYLDSGYLKFNVDSTQVSITPNKKSIYITVNLTEGEKYTVSKIKLVGNLIVDKKELLNKITIKSGDIFSRKQITKSQEQMIERIGDEGYAFADINAVPEIDSKNKTVALNFYVDPGKRVYVRRINFKGNLKTRDEVLRREMRQMEGGFLSQKKIKRSKTRLERLSFFETVEVKTPRVANSNDQVDVNFNVVERPSGNLMAGVGYSQIQGIIFNASILQDNFLGSGKRVGVTFNNSRVNTMYRLSYFNPYTTIDGVSRGFDVFYRTMDAEFANLSRYASDAYGTRLNYGFPISEYNYVSMGAEIDNTTIKTTTFSADEVFKFLERNGNNYTSYRLTANWRHDTRNRVLFPDKGVLQSLNAEVALPVSDLSFYKLTYRHQWLYPLIKDYILVLKGQVAYGEAYGDSTEYPFFENFTAGGPRTVRGFRGNTLGPLDSQGLPFGGNLRVVSNAEVILPIPFTKKLHNFRLSAFVDVGNVYGVQEDFDVDQLRYSTGLSAIWLSPLGVLSFSLAKPLNQKPGDQIETFQFTIGTTFNW